MIFAAALAQRVTARNLACTCCTDNECECEGEQLGPAFTGPGAADPVLGLLARASDSREPVSAAADETAALVLSFPGVAEAGARAAARPRKGQLRR
jgi:hypothetical protein